MEKTLSKQWESLSRSIMKHKLLYAVAAAATILLLAVLLPALQGLNIYSSGFQGPSASFTNIQFAPGGTYSGYGSAPINIAGKTASMAYNIQPTSITLTPTLGTKEYTQFLASMGGVSGFNGMPTTPIETYSFNLTQPNYDNNVYTMTLWNLTWTVNLATSTAWQESGGPYTLDYTNLLLNINVALNQGDWYISGVPNNVYFGIAAIVLQNDTNFSKNSNCPVATLPSSDNDLLSITSPTNGETATDAFYSYEDQALNPTYFAPSVSTSITAVDVGPYSNTNWLGQLSGYDASVRLTFSVYTFVVGEWTVKPTYGGEGSGIPPGQITVQGGPNILGGLSNLFNSLEKDLADNPLVDIVLLIMIAGIGLIIAVVFFPELTKSLSKASAKTINNHTKNKSRSRSRSNKKNG
jgi:hypothetical protein